MRTGGAAASAGTLGAGGLVSMGGGRPSRADAGIDASPGGARDGSSTDATSPRLDASQDSSRDASVDAIRDTDAELYCPTRRADAGQLGPGQFLDCTGWSICNGYADLIGWDPCQPWNCGATGGQYCYMLGYKATGGYVAADGTPCDEGDPRSFAGSSPCATDGDCPHGGSAVCVGGERDGRGCTTDDECTPNRAGPCRPTCAGGSNAGSPCNLDVDCPSSTCSTATKRCNAGSNRGSVCTTNSDCNGALVDYSSEGISGCDKFCRGGTAPTNPLAYCFTNQQCSSLYGSSALCCPGGGPGCGSQLERCNGGLLDGQNCIHPSDCVAARCVKWSCDAAPSHYYCVGQDGIPSCPNGQTDCDLTPYNKFCPRDPDYTRDAWVKGTLADPACGTDGTTCPNTCNDGIYDYGPAVTYTCNTTTHQCLNSSVPCLGGAHGAGSTCNNVCRGGRCTSDLAICR